MSTPLTRALAPALMAAFLGLGLGFRVSAGGAEGASSLELDLKRMGAAVFTDAKTGEITEINLNGHPGVTMALMKRIAQLPNLTDLSLERTPIQTAHVLPLAGLKKLEWLNLFETRIDDRSLAELARIPTLTHLPIGKTRITDKGLRAIRELGQLQYLGLRGNAITDEGLKHLVGLRSLTGLHLGETKVTDAGLPHLKTLTRLEKLWLHGTAVSDAGLEPLTALRHLRQLLIYDTRVTEDGYRELQRALPDCFILYKVDMD